MMKKKDILPTLGRGFVAGTLAVQSFHAFQAEKFGSLIGLSASFLIFVAMSYSSMCCNINKDCDIGSKPKRKAA